MTGALRYLLIAFLTACFATGIRAQDVEDHKEQRDTLQREISLINRQLSANKKQQKNSLNTLALTQRKIENRKILISKMDDEISRYKESISSKSDQINKLNIRLQTLLAYYEALVYNTYKNRDTRVWFMYLLSSENISQAVRRWSYLKNISSTVKIQADEIKATRTSLEKERRELNNAVRKSNEEQQHRKDEFEQLSEDEESLSQTLETLSKQEKQMRKQLEAKQKEMDRINKEIERIITNTVKSEKSSDEVPSEEFANLTEKFEGSKGRIRQPVNGGVIVERYGQSDHPVFKNVKLPFNNGINISVSEDSPALAVFNGVVKQVLVIPGYNQCVLVQHGRYYTFYCKLKKASVKAGQKITAGEEVGSVETSSDGHTILHFELWDGTAKQNPQDWIRY